MDTKYLIRQIKKKLPKIDTNRLKAACDMAVVAHKHQVRSSGEPYYIHPFHVALILADLQLDEDSIITAILHDTVEDTVITLDDVEREFGKDVAKLVDGVTKLAKIKFQPDHIRQAENFRKLLLAMSDDIRVLIVKLCDRLHNMQTIGFLKDREKVLRIAHETAEIYAPLAERIGIRKIKNELQELAFEVLHPEERRSIVSRLEYLRKDGIALIDKIEMHVKKTLEDTGMSAAVYGREKTPYSIWHKMQRKDVSFEQLSDIIAFRVIVDDVNDCYQVLGIIHAAYHMVPGSFKDYVSTPKENGYRSIHTVVVGPEKERIEVQIRTAEMEEVNELGVAAHWAYKQNFNYGTDGKQFRWIRELLAIWEHSNAEEFIEHTKLEMYEEQVFCFTPQGQIVPLPRNATLIDFAYAVHSEVGHSCVGAKVNGRIVPLRHTLQNGDQVEIIRSKNAVPSATWEKNVVTAKAKHEIKKFLRGQQRKEYIALGEKILHKIFKEEERDYRADLVMLSLKTLQKKTLDELLLAIGDGSLPRSEVCKVLFGEKKNKIKLSLKESLSFFKFSKKKEKKENPIVIKGLAPGMAINFASCCYPLPGENIVGIVHTGKGVTIHSGTCEILENYVSTPEKWIDVEWDQEGQDSKHIGRIRATLLNQPGSLATFCNSIANQNGNITNVKIIGRSSDFFDLITDIEVSGIKQLSNIIAALRAEYCIHSAERF